MPAGHFHRGQPSPAFGGGDPVGVEQKVRPARINVSNIPGQGSVTVRWIVRGNGPFTVIADSPKGGMARATTGR